MQVILLKSVPKVGKKDEIVEVNTGFAENALFRQKLAIPASDAAVAALMRRKQNDNAEKMVRHQLLDAAIASLGGASVVMPVKANEQGNLFSKIHEADIATYLETKRIAIDQKCIELPDGPIKKLGTYPIGVRDGEYAATFNLELTHA